MRSDQAPWINKFAEGFQLADIETTHAITTTLRRNHPWQ